MRKISLASGCLATILVMTGCAANDGGRFVPPSLGQNRAVVKDGSGGFEPDTGSSIVEFKFGTSGFTYLTPDFAGNEWFSSVDPLALLAINERTGAFTQYNLPASYSRPLGLALNPARDVLWFTEPSSNAIGYMNLYNHSVGQFTIPTHDSNPGGITAGPNNGMWFTETAGKIGRIDTITHAFREYKLPHGSLPYRITLGPDNALWFSNLNSIGRITTHGHVHVYSIGQNIAIGITTGLDGGIWFTGHSDPAHNDGSMLGRIDPLTHIRKIYAYAAGSGGNTDLTERNSDFWMTREQGNRIDRFDHVTHIIHSRPLPHGYTRPFGIALGEDDQIWFINQGTKTGAVGKLCPGLPASQCKGAL